MTDQAAWQSAVEADVHDREQRLIDESLLGS